MNNLQNMCEGHNKILLKHDSTLKDTVTLQVFLTKLSSFEKTIEAKVDTTLYSFNENLASKFNSKLDKDEFNDKIRKKACNSELAEMQNEMDTLRTQIRTFGQVLERKADEEAKIPTPTLEELERLDRQKANKEEIEDLKQQISRLEQLIHRYDEESSDNDFSETYEDEESEEDVLSLEDIEEHSKPLQVKMEDIIEEKLDQDKDKKVVKEETKEKQENDNKEEEKEKPVEKEIKVIQEIIEPRTPKTIKSNKGFRNEEIETEQGIPEKSTFSKTIKAEIKLEKALEVTLL